MNDAALKPSVLHLSVEEENLATIPFAVLERRTGKRNSIDIFGTKMLPDGSELKVSWQIRGNPELGLPTEQDLDVFIALGVLTFQNNLAKTITFTGREIAKILGIRSVHGKFYQRLKIAMDRFIPLRFRGIAATERQEDIKWVNIFQEASFTLDKDTGRCVGSVTWTDKLIDSMNNGFFRVLDAGRYMELDGITAKHLYRFLAVALEETDLLVIDARKLAVERLGILNPPKYLSRLMQTLEPALDQLVRIKVLASYHVIDSEKWQIAIQRHDRYVPERKMLLSPDSEESLELNRSLCRKRLEKAGFSEELAAVWAGRATTPGEFYQLDRAGRLLEEFLSQGVLLNVAASLIRQSLDTGVQTPEAIEFLDLCEIAVDTCKWKKNAGQNVRNPAGLLVRMVRDPAAARRIVPAETMEKTRQDFRRREKYMMAQQQLAEQRSLVLEYETWREQTARTLFESMPEMSRAAQRKEKAAWLKQQKRLEQMDAETREREIDQLICDEIAKKEVAPFERWYARKRVGQTVLPFLSGGSACPDEAPAAS